jgi:oxygen-dependent protoporphyrinogen oxidase
MESATTPRSRATRHVVIVGGGISGLSAAWYLQEQARRDGLDLRYTVLESAPRWGGKILTEVVGDSPDAAFVVEGGPDAFLTQKPWALELARELGLADRLVPMNDGVQAVFVLQRGRPVPMPEGVLLVVPTRFLPFLKSPLISIPGKVRMGMDLFLPGRRDDGDETLASFIRRRLGQEALDKIAEPLMSGIYNADAEDQSIMATFPRFREMEKKHGSLIRGMLAARRREAAARAAAPGGAPKKTPMFMSLRLGTQELIDALVPRLTGDLRLGTAVDAIARVDDGYRVTTGDGAVLAADVVLLTTPAYTSADLLSTLAPTAAELMGGIRYVSTGTISMAFRAQDIRRPLGGIGLVVPKGEARPINALTISSAKFDHRAPGGTVLMRAFFGGSRSPASMKYDDAALLEVVRGELRDILDIEAMPLFHRIYRWHRANPQYGVGHMERVARIEASLPVGLHVSGGAYRGVGMPDCVYQSKQTVARILERIRTLQTTESNA